ncbi:MAG TPA: hypothetical protein VFF35_15630 [Bacteroidia bacterium]|nr:hypothetical protein [Bacteroidia bacterium]
MKLKSKKTKKVMAIIMTAIGSTGVKKTNSKLKRKAKKLAKQVVKSK